MSKIQNEVSSHKVEGDTTPVKIEGVDALSDGGARGVEGKMVA